QMMSVTADMQQMMSVTADVQQMMNPGPTSSVWCFFSCSLSILHHVVRLIIKRFLNWVASRRRGWLINTHHVRGPMTLICSSDFEDLQRDIRLFSQSTASDEDIWEWTVESKSEFNVKSVKNLIWNSTETNSSFQFK
ncbi:hypothetical protein M8C21_026319, partial [Ambrosia artemisiifolia]